MPSTTVLQAVLQACRDRKEICRSRRVQVVRFEESLAGADYVNVKGV